MGFGLVHRIAMQVISLRYSPIQYACNMGQSWVTIATGLGEGWCFELPTSAAVSRAESGGS